MNKEEQDNLKNKAAIKAATKVRNNMSLGIGTGSTVKFFIDELGRKKKEEGLYLKNIVTTSSRSKKQLESLGFKIDKLSDVDQVDLTVDGVDRIDSNLDGIKGGGGALTLEKNVAVNSKKVIWIADESKLASDLSKSGFKLPLEVLPISCEQNFNRFKKEGLKPVWRMSGKSRFITHYGNYIIDLNVIPQDITNFANSLDHIVGLIEHGLFLGICDEAIIAHDSGEIEVKDRK